MRLIFRDADKKEVLPWLRKTLFLWLAVFWWLFGVPCGSTIAKVIEDESDLRVPGLVSLHSRPIAVGNASRFEREEPDWNVSEPEPADWVLLNAKIWTVDDRCPEAEGLAVQGNRLVAVGTNQEIAKWIGENTQVIDATGRTVVPGFIDAHLHPEPMFPEDSPFGVVDCSPQTVPDLPSLVSRLRAKAEVTPAGQWIIGERYQDTKLGRHPTRDDLDEVSRRHPIYLNHSSSHVAAVNSFALQLAGVDSSTADPRGGMFDREPDGRLTGVLRESAKRVVRDAGPELPKPSTAEWMAGIQARFDQYLSHGITTVQHAGTTWDTVEKYRTTLAAKPQVRIYPMLRENSVETAAKQRELVSNEWLWLGAVKFFHGNSLSGQTCWLSEPYEGRPDYYGIPPSRSQQELDRLVAEIHNQGLQCCIHANGDREIEMVLLAYERALDAVPRENHRHRIEHASVCPDHLLPRIKKLGLVLATHSYVWEHGDKMEVYGAKRWEYMHPNGSATRAGIWVAGNSDSPVSEAKPLLRLQSMATRTSAEGKVYGPSQRITFAEALRIWTLGGAYACFAEGRLGSLTPGKLADLVILEKDPTSLPAHEWRTIAVLATYVDGECRFARPEWKAALQR